MVKDGIMWGGLTHVHARSTISVQHMRRCAVGPWSRKPRLIGCGYLRFYVRQSNKTILRETERWEIDSAALRSTKTDIIRPRPAQPFLRRGLKELMPNC